MSNKTYDKQLVIREPGLPAAKDGYVRIIMRESGVSRQHISTLTTNSNYKPKFLESKQDLVTYYVNQQKNLRLTPNPRPRQHISNVNGRGFHLTIHLQFNITDVKTLVTNIDRDPATLLEDELFNVLSRPIEQLPWEQITNDDTDFTQKALTATSLNDQGEALNNRAFLNAHAAELGLHVIDIQIQRTLSEAAMENKNAAASRDNNLQNSHNKAAYDVEQKGIDEQVHLQMQRQEAERHSYEAQIEDLKYQRQQDREILDFRFNQQKEAQKLLFDITANIAENNLGKVRSIAEFGQHLTQIQALLAGSNALPENANNNPKTLWGNNDAQAPSQAPSLAHTPAIADPSTASDNPTEIIKQGGLASLIKRLEGMAQDLEDNTARQQLLATSLHLIAETQLAPQQQQQQGTLELARQLRQVWRQHGQQFSQQDTVLLNALMAPWEEKED